MYRVTSYWEFPSFSVCPTDELGFSSIQSILHSLITLHSTRDIKWSSKLWSLNYKFEFKFGIVTFDICFLRAQSRSFDRLRHGLFDLSGCCLTSVAHWTAAVASAGSTIEWVRDGRSAGNKTISLMYSCPHQHQLCWPYLGCVMMMITTTYTPSDEQLSNTFQNITLYCTLLSTSMVNGIAANFLLFSYWPTNMFLLL